jgi:hypothetical protein
LIRRTVRAEKIAATNGHPVKTHMAMMCPRARAAVTVETNGHVKRRTTKMRLLVGGHQTPNLHERIVRTDGTDTKWMKTMTTWQLLRVREALIERVAVHLAMKMMKAPLAEKKLVPVSKLVKPSELRRWPLSERPLRQSVKHELPPKHSP